MDLKLFLTTFLTIFLAEIGDKTQFAAMAAAAQAKSLIPVWLGVVFGLALAGTVGVFAGRMLSEWLNPQVLKYVAAGAFFVMGGLILINSKP
ncbi:MAG: TMEM165/GDT1 family protein [Bdellovibrionales bacterium]